MRTAGSLDRNIFIIKITLYTPEYSDVQIFIQQKADGLTSVERRSDTEFITLKASPATGKVDYEYFFFKKK